MILIESYNVLCFIFSKICIALFYCALIPWIYRLVDKIFFYFHGKLIICKWTCELTYFMSRDYYQLILFTLVDKLHICVLLICFFLRGKLLFIHSRKEDVNKKIYIYFAWTQIRKYPNLFYRKNHNKTLDLDIFYNIR